MGQVNVAYDDAILRRLDALAERLGHSRSDLLRRAAEEMVRADEDGRPLFEPRAVPLGPEVLAGLVHEIRQMNIDLDRQMRAAEKREKRLLESCNATEEANRSARERHGKDLANRFREGATPFSIMLGDFRKDIVERHDAILSAIREPESVKAMRVDVTVVKSLLLQRRRKADRPLHALHFHIGRNLKVAGWELGVGAAVVILVLLAVQSGIGHVLPYSWWATPISQSLYGSSETGACELYKAAREADDCKALSSAKKGDGK